MKTLSGIIAVIIFLLTISVPLSAQQSTYAKVFYDNLGSAQAYSIIRSSDNNYVIAGEKDSGGLLIKMEPDGTILWDKRYGSAGIDRFNAVIETKDSCFVLTGFHLNAANTQSVLCVKVNPQGDVLWSRTIDNGFWCTGLSIQQTIDDGFILAGFTYQTSGPSTIMIVDKLNAAGILTWSNTMVCGTHHNYACSVKQTPDSGYIVTGSFDNYTPPISPGVMIKLSQYGSVSWAYNLTGNDYSCITDVSVNTDGLLFSVFNGNGIVLMKTDFSGTVLWSKAGSSGGLYGGGDNPLPRLYKTGDDGYAMINAWQMVKTDSAGNFLWSQDLFFYPSDVIESADKGFLALGNGPVWGVEMTETLNPQIGIIKTDSLGNSTACVMQSNVMTDIITIVLEPVTVTSNTAGIQSDLPLTSSNAGLSADSGCVAYTGGVKEINQGKNIILVYPNPSNGLIRLKADPACEGDLKSIKIYDVTGKCIYYTDDPHSFQSEIDVTAAPDGIYFLKAVFNDSVCTKMFTVCR
jgi:hypothetical protein